MNRFWSIASYYIVATVAFVCFFVLGRNVTANGEPGLLVQWESALFDHSTLVAWWLTWACYPKFLIPVCIVLLILAWRFKEWAVRIVVSIFSLVVAWRAADLCQHVFERARPVQWVVKHEATFSYPSSHAAIVAGFYLLWAILLYGSDLPKSSRTIGALLLTLFGLAICWSRLALGAHYITDIAGGLLLGLVCTFFVLGGLSAGSPGGSGGRASQSAE